ncbi:unnamed protein product [Clonostachys solani]|uniref:Carboxypeptidase M14B n=1 Tax=Clonostachys solani TaxID=160281 RepID=A0A9N9ZIL2_9HYPO|nr:unnamed protein product [Clonostachys solani]
MARLNLLFASLLSLVDLGNSFVYQNNQAGLTQDEPHVAANFPEPTGIEVFSPSFDDPETVPSGFANGTSGPTSQYKMESYLQTLAARNDWITYHNPSIRSEEGRTLPYVYLSTSTSQESIITDLRSPGSFSSFTNSTQKIRVLLQGGVHGNEPAGDEGLLALIGKMDANQTWAASILENIDILILPRYNPDGVAYFQRQLASNLDPNRDHTKMTSQQTRDIKKLVMEFAPHLAADCHEYTAPRGVGANAQWLPSQDGQFCGVKNLNVHEDILKLQEGLFADSMAAALERNGLRWSAYITGNSGTDDIVLEETTSDAKYGDVSIGLNQAVVFTLETRGIRLGDQHWKRRLVSQLTMVEALLEAASDNYESVFSTIENARTEFISSDKDIIITDYARETNITWPYIERDTGKIVDVPVTMMNCTPMVANLTRPRPEAYIFPRAWRLAAELLRDSGVIVEELKTNFKGTVSALNITTATLATTKYEGIAMTTVTTKSFEKEVEIPAGGYVVSTRQKNAVIAFNTLEPETVDSFAKFNILPVVAGDEYQVYRIY